MMCYYLNVHFQGQKFKRSVIWLSELPINSWVIWKQSYYRTGYIATNDLERWSRIYSKNLEGNSRGWFGVYKPEFFRTTCDKVGQKLIFRQSTSPNRNSGVGRCSRPPSIIKSSEWNQGNHDGLIVNLYDEIIYKVVQIWLGLFTLLYTQISPGHIWTTMYNNNFFMVKLLRDYIKN